MRFSSKKKCGIFIFQTKKKEKNEDVFFLTQPEAIVFCFSSITETFAIENSFPEQQQQQQQHKKKQLPVDG